MAPTCEGRAWAHWTCTRRGATRRDTKAPVQSRLRIVPLASLRPGGATEQKQTTRSPGGGRDQRGTPGRGPQDPKGQQAASTRANKPTNKPTDKTGGQEGESERANGQATGRRADRQTDRQASKQARQTNKQTDTDTKTTGPGANRPASRARPTDRQAERPGEREGEGRANEGEGGPRQKGLSQLRSGPSRHCPTAEQCCTAARRTG